MDALDGFDTEVQHLIAELQGLDVYNFGWGSITTFTPWIFITPIIMFLVIWYFKNNVTYLPKRNFVAILEIIVEYLKKEIGDNLLGHHAREHMPFLLTAFFFIVGANLLGLVPGGKSATGTISVTAAVALCSFGYFNYAGAKHYGLWTYIKHIAPAGMPPVVNVMVWVIEAFSMTLRIATLSIRLFINMFAGHLVMGCFALLASMFARPMVEHFSLRTLVTAGVPALGWVMMLMIVVALELFVAFIQAYIFTLLSGVYIMLATSEH